jgi:hypothetical protein
MSRLSLLILLIFGSTIAYAGSGTDVLPPSSIKQKSAHTYILEQGLATQTNTITTQRCPNDQWSTGPQRYTAVANVSYRSSYVSATCPMLGVNQNITFSLSPTTATQYRLQIGNGDASSFGGTIIFREGGSCSNLDMRNVQFFYVISCVPI